MWTSVLERLMKLSGGRRDGRIAITTRRIDKELLARLDQRLAASPRARQALADLAGRSLNFDPAALAGVGEHNGWHVDDYREPLPPEPPGAPVAGTSFETPQRPIGDFAFADPAIVRAVYDPATGLPNRNMLLQPRFGPLRFFVGCRVGPIDDATRTVGGRLVRQWGWTTARSRVASSAGR